MAYDFDFNDWPIEFRWDEVEGFVDYFDDLFILKYLFDYMNERECVIIWATLRLLNL